MPVTYDKIYELLGTSSIPPTDALGNTTDVGSYMTTGIDLWSLPGVLTPIRHNGTFKKGPISLFSSGTARDYWWAARMQDADTASLQIYSVSSIGATLRYTSSLMPSWPRAFDFDINQNGHVVVVAEINEKLYSFYSFSSSLGWQLLASASSFTPKLLFVDNACVLSYFNNDIDYNPILPINFYGDGESHQFFAELNTIVATDRFDNGIQTKNYFGPMFSSSISIPDIINVTSSVISGDPTQLYPVLTLWKWRGSVSGSMTGIMTGSMKGSITGTLNDGPFGSFVVSPPSILYGTLIGEMNGIFGGNFTGVASVTGSFYGTISGYFSGTYYDPTHTGSFSTPDMLPNSSIGTAPTGSLWFVGSISGTLDGAVFPDSQSIVKPLYFIDNIIATKSNRMQLTYGIYDPVAQNATYTTLTSQPNITETPSSGPAGGGVPFVLEILIPTDQNSPPVFAQRAIPVLPPAPQQFPSGALPTDLGSGHYSSLAISVNTNMEIVNGVGEYEYNFVIGSSGSSAWSYHNTGSTYAAEKNVGTSLYGGGTFSPSPTIAYEAPHIGLLPGVPPSMSIAPYTGIGYAIGVFFPSNSLNSEIFDGSHRPAVNANIGFDHATLVAGGSSTYGLETGLSTTDTNNGAGFYAGVFILRTLLNVGVKARLLFNDPSASFTCSIVPLSTYVGPTGSTLYTAVVSPNQIIGLTIPSFSYGAIPSLGTLPTILNPTVPDAYEPTWYPSVRLDFSFTGSTSHTMYSSSIQTNSYLVSARSII